MGHGWGLSAQSGALAAWNWRPIRVEWAVAFSLFGGFVAATSAGT